MVRFHSGQAIANHFNITRAAIWKHMKWLEQQGLPIVSITNKGYCLKVPFELLDKKTIEVLLPAKIKQQLQALIIKDSVGSTNDYLYSHGNAPFTVCLAEMQQQGKARRTKNWNTPYTGNIACSLNWNSEQPPAELQGLGLVFSLAVIKSLHNIGVLQSDLGIKWPNDIWLKGKKLAGILVEVHGEANSQTRIITGIGVNGWLPEHVKATIRQPTTDLSETLSLPYPRNQLAAMLIENCYDYLQKFLTSGLVNFLAEWQQYDILKGQQISMKFASKTIQGQYQGIDPQGHLLLQVDGHIKKFAAGRSQLYPSLEQRSNVKEVTHMPVARNTGCKSQWFSNHKATLDMLGNNQINTTPGRCRAL